MEMQKLSRRVTQVTLSERNILTLLAKVQNPESDRTMMRETEDGVLLVTAESDAYHYRDREPGLQSPWVERVIANYTGR